MEKDFDYGGRTYKGIDGRYAAKLHEKLMNGDYAELQKTENFARSLVRTYQRACAGTGTISQKQEMWIEKLATASPSEHNPEISIIRAGNGLLDEKGRVFGISLVDQWDRMGFLSSKQEWWVKKLSEKISALTPHPKAPKSPIVEEVRVPNRINNPHYRKVLTNLELDGRAGLAISDDIVNVELRPNVWALINTKTNTIIGTFESESLADAALK
jgi:hypothetical protein